MLLRRCLIFGIVAAVVPASFLPASGSPPPAIAGKLQWRSIGPYIGGRVVAVAGVSSQPNLFYMGGVQGGVWKSTDYGQDWINISDGKLPRTASAIGALAVAPSNANVIYAGTGEADIRGDFDTGEGVYKSVDAGKTWHYAGLRDTHMTTKLAIDPRNANVVYAASMGHVFAPSPDRGVFKTTDGGTTWRRVLFVDSNTGGVDLVLDQAHPNVLYAAMWQAQRVPWKLTSGGPGSGLYKTTDGGAHWSKISTNPGYASGTLGKIGVSIVASNPQIVYSIVQAANGGIYRSDNGGRSWRYVNNEMKFRQRAFYYTAIFADPKNANVVYAPEVDGVYRSKDGAKTFTLLHPPHGDCHILWINPNDTRILLEGDDGGATVSVDTGQHWSHDDNQPTGQYYHVLLDDQFPFHVYGAAQ
ncbi:MAG: glycosyl hydrolase, partial [Candidatus Eremiobacteraeota bacterium]|nr:glycosyl hydrolase [Candidatus Eremiobacteraeota bacterium]